MPSVSFTRIVVVALSMFFACSSTAQDSITHLWYNEKKTAKIQVYQSADGLYNGKIVWLKLPNRNGKPKVDFHNPDKSKKSNPILGLQILKGFKKTGDNLYEDGTVYDPENGKTYSCKLTHNGDELDVRGFVGISLFGRTTKWTSAE